MLSFGCDFIDVEILRYQFVCIVHLLAACAERFLLGLDEGVAAGVAGVYDGRSVIVHADVLQDFVALGAPQLSAEIVSVLWTHVGASEVVYHLLCLNGRLPAFGAGLYIEYV